MTWLKKILGIDKLETQAEQLKGVVAIQEQELKNYRGYANYVTVPVPNDKAVNQFLCDLCNSKMFQFYLMTQKNDIVMRLINSKDKDADTAKGALRLIEKIRDDMNAAATEIGKQNAQV